MRQVKPKGMLERSVSADLFRHTLTRIPTFYGRLMYLASLRDPNSGIYRHHGLSTTFGRDESIRALQSSHTRTFREWLKLPLRDKSSDLVEYLDSLEEPRGAVVRHWLRSKVYLAGIPDAASKAERELYTGDLEVLLPALGHLSHEFGADGSGPKSWPRK